jgi:hypothetical protein
MLQQEEERVGRVKVFRGVCGWSPRQLDGEVRRGGGEEGRVGRRGGGDVAAGT